MTATILERPAEAQDPVSPAELDQVALKAASRIFQAWNLTIAQASALIRESERNWSRIKKDHSCGPLDSDQRTRASAIVGIYRGLHDCFGSELADAWVRLPNTGPLFGGAKPIDFMTEGGITALLATRDYVDAMRGGM